MRLDKLTVKLQEALQEAISFATESGHQQVEPEYLFYALFKAQESIIAAIFDKLGIAIFSIIKAIEEDIIETGFDINFGARPLNRALQKYIQNPLSLKLLEGSLKEGDKIVTDLDKDKRIIFRTN
jgi:ATP-dependent Clp protease ATP-binding subunit ClpA